MLTTSSQSLIIRYDRTLETKKGYSPATSSGSGTSQQYLGTPDRLYTRYRMSHSRDFSLGLPSKKMPGNNSAGNLLPGATAPTSSPFTAIWKTRVDGKELLLATTSFKLAKAYYWVLALPWVRGRKQLPPCGAINQGFAPTHR